MKKTDAYAALRYREFKIFLLVQFAIIFAWSMQFVVIEWGVYSLTKDPLSLGYIGLIEVIPAVLMALFAGHITDRQEKKGLLAKSLLGFSVISLGLFLLTLPQTVNNWSPKFVLAGIYFLVFAGGFIRAFIGPTTFSLVALLIPKSLYPNAASWNSTVGQLGRVLGPAIAGLTISLIGMHWSMSVVFLCSLVSFTCLLFISRKPILNIDTNQSVWGSIKEGVSFVFHEKIIFGAITLDMIAVLFGGAVALLPIFAQDILKVGSTGFGVLRAAPAIGSFITMFLTAYFTLHKKAGIKLLFAVFGFGVCIIVFGVSRIFLLSVVALFFSGVVDGISMVIRQTILQLKTPDGLRGRVASVNSIFLGSSNELGAFESGFTARLMGTVSAVVFGGCMTLITVLTMGAVLPSFRKLDLQTEIEKHKNID